MPSEYVFLDENNIVVDGISGIDFDDTSNLADGFSSWEEFYGNFKGLTCKRTDLKTQSNQHEDGGTPLFYVSNPEMADLLRKSGANE